jgi:2-oxoglutarate dehydrogenase E1 component
LEQGSFKPIIEDDLSEGGKVERAVLLSGKVFHDVAAALKPLGKLPVKIIRVEQLHPFPQFEFKKALKDVTSTSVLWVQEEPENMGAWSYVQPYLERKLGLDAAYVGRPTSATTATGSPKHHAREQKAIVDEVVKFATGG